MTDEEKQLKTLMKWSDYNSETADQLGSKTATQLVITSTFVITFSSAFLTNTKHHISSGWKTILVFGWILEVLSIVLGFIYLITSHFVFSKNRDALKKASDKVIESKKISIEKISLKPAPFLPIVIQFALTIVGLVLIVLYASKLLF